MSERGLGKHETFHRVTKHELLKTKEGRDLLPQGKQEGFSDWMLYCTMCISCMVKRLENRLAI